MTHQCKDPMCPHNGPYAKQVYELETNFGRHGAPGAAQYLMKQVNEHPVNVILLKTLFTMAVQMAPPNHYEYQHELVALCNAAATPEQESLLAHVWALTLIDFSEGLQRSLDDLLKGIGQSLTSKEKAPHTADEVIAAGALSQPQGPTLTVVPMNQLPQEVRDAVAEGLKNVLPVNKNTLH